MAVPRWFIPDGVTRPSHLPAGGIGVRSGPDGLSGLCVGGPYKPGEDGWIRLHPGHWMHLVGCQPQQFLRMTPVDGATITGLETHQWLVPLLLRPVAGGLRCAMPQVLTEQGFAPPAAYATLMQALRDLMVPALAEIRAAHQEEREAVLGFAESEAVQLAIDLLAINYHLSRSELVHLGWVTDVFVTRILMAASGLVEVADG